MGRLADLDVLAPPDRDAWRAWLAGNHATAPGVLVLLRRRPDAGDALTYEAAVEEALCYGWIDGRQQPHDVGMVRQHFAPRRPGGPWARSNRERVERLEREGRMTEAGRRVVEAARLDGSWTALEEIDALLIPGDLAAALAATPLAAEQFARFSPSVRRGYLWWIKSARRPETRAQRIADTVWLTGQGIKEPGRRR